MHDNLHACVYGHICVYSERGSKYVLVGLFEGSTGSRGGEEDVENEEY
jgi:hypothetical protein